MIEAYPLYWPEGWKRCRVPHSSNFKSSFTSARDGLINEIKRLGGTKIILSTNIPLRIDGLPYASAREPENSGIAAYFKHKGKDMVFACDEYNKVWENMVAVRKTIEAIRGIERWNASDMLERAFAGFKALQDPNKLLWREVLGIHQDEDDINVIKHRFKQLCSDYHPDKPSGNSEIFDRINKAWSEAKAEIEPR